MGAAMTQHPELYGAIVCGYPLLDMLRYQNFRVGRFGRRSTARRTTPRTTNTFARTRRIRT